MSTIERFYSFLTGRKITGKEYEHVLNVWNKSEIETMKDYSNLYLKYDVLLLADVFENPEIIAWGIMDYVHLIIWADKV